MSLWIRFGYSGLAGLAFGSYAKVLNLVGIEALAFLMAGVLAWNVIWSWAIEGKDIE